eukprot:10073684-Ditylum_brightwellii.AAC.1
METTVLVLYALRLHARIAQDLMMQVAPHVGHSGFKFLPASLPYDKSIQDGKVQYARLLKEQNQLLGNYKDSQIGGISEDLIGTKFGDNTLRNLLELSGVVGDITPTLFIKAKGIWQVETTEIQVVDIMRHVSKILSKIRD